MSVTPDNSGVIEHSHDEFLVKSTDSPYDNTVAAEISNSEGRLIQKLTTDGDARATSTLNGNRYWGSIWDECIAPLTFTPSADSHDYGISEGSSFTATPSSHIGNSSYVSLSGFFPNSVISQASIGSSSSWTTDDDSVDDVHTNTQLTFDSYIPSGVGGHPIANSSIRMSASTSDFPGQHPRDYEIHVSARFDEVTHGIEALNEGKAFMATEDTHITTKKYVDSMVGSSSFTLFDYVLAGTTWSKEELISAVADEELIEASEIAAELDVTLAQGQMILDEANRQINL